MPSTSSRETPFIERFLSAYEGYSWANADIEWLDRATDGAVEARATRKTDQRTLAIEHTIIEPFAGEKEDFAFFKRAFLEIEKDKSLAVAGRYIQVFVPVGVLRAERKKAGQDKIVDAVRRWIKTHRTLLSNGRSQHTCSVTGIPERSSFAITLNVEVQPLLRDLEPLAGVVHIRRQQIEDSFNKVVEKALRKKLPKLVNTPADKRILLLERQHMNLYPSAILAEIDNQRSSFSDLANVDEIWIIETILYRTDFGGEYLRFVLYDKEAVVKSYDFMGEKLLTRFEDGIEVHHI